VKALSALVRYSKFLETSRPEGIPEVPVLPDQREKVKGLLKTFPRIITEDQGKKILSSYGIPVAKEELGKSPEEIRKIAGRIGYPVALKIVSPQIQHKTEAGGLKLNISNEKELSGACEEILENVKRYRPDAEVAGMLVQEMVPSGKELIIGVTRDAQFGPMVMFGLGGVFVEVLKDFSLRHAPLKERDAWEMIQEIRGYRILEGVRGGQRSHLESIAQALMAVSRMAVDLGGIFAEMDINPLVVYPGQGGVKAIDCLFAAK
jgi:acetyltransferase